MKPHTQFAYIEDLLAERRPRGVNHFGPIITRSGNWAETPVADSLAIFSGGRA